MPNVSFFGLFIVAVVAFLAPLLLGLSPARRLPAVVLEIVAGIIIGPSVLGWVRVDLPISILSLFGLAFLLFLAGLEVELERLKGRLMMFIGLAFLLSFGLALLVGYGLYAGGQVLAVVLAFVVLRLERSMRLTSVLLRLQDTTAQIRVRAAFILLVAFVALAEGFGLETILGAFIAGVILRLVDRDRAMTHPTFRLKLEAIGFGVFIPIFFVTSGLRFDLAALLASPSTILRVPIFLAALLLVRGVPALLYRPLTDSRRTIIAGLLQATSLSFIVAASQIGMELGLITKVKEPVSNEQISN